MECLNSYWGTILIGLALLMFAAGMIAWATPTDQLDEILRGIDDHEAND